MAFLLHQLIAHSAQRTPDAPALLCKQETWSYRDLQQQVERVAAGLRALGVERDERVAIYLPKQFETVSAMFGALAAGGVFVPVNPVLKAEQVGHILRDCATRVLVTSADRARVLTDTLAALLGKRVRLNSPVTGLEAPSDDFVQAIPCSQTVMELKYNDKLPQCLLRRLNSLGLQQRTFSKYATSVERCFRGLNGNYSLH